MAAIKEDLEGEDENAEVGYQTAVPEEIVNLPDDNAQSDYIPPQV